VSYDIYFVRRDPGQSFEDALDEIEDAFEGDPGPLTPTELEQWEDVLPTAREVLGEVEEFEDETTRELTHPQTGIQLALFNGEIAIHVDSTSLGDSGEVMTTLYELARAIEDVTGLEGYDPQREEPVSEHPEGAPPVRRSASDWDDDDDNEPDGTSTTLPSVRPRDDDEAGADAGRDEPGSYEAGAPGDRPRRWWEFWKS
jgi:hypothetical protein